MEDQLLHFKKIVIEAEKIRLKNLLDNYSDYSTKSIIQILQESVLKADKAFDRNVKDAEKYKEFDFLYSSYIDSIKDEYNIITKGVEEKILELEKKLNNK